MGVGIVVPPAPRVDSLYPGQIVVADEKGGLSLATNLLTDKEAFVPFKDGGVEPLNIFISPTGSDSNDGLMPDEPMLSPAAACVKYRNPHTLQLTFMNGTHSAYTIGWTLPSRPILIIRGQHRDNTIITGPLTVNGYAGMVFMRAFTLVPSNTNQVLISGPDSGGCVLNMNSVTVNGLYSGAKANTGIESRNPTTELQFVTIRNCQNAVVSGVGSLYAMGVNIENTCVNGYMVQHGAGFVNGASGAAPNVNNATGPKQTVGPGGIFV